MYGGFVSAISERGATTRHHQKVPTLFLNLDITKAFDSVLWSFMLEVMRHLGFGMSWCKLISNMLATSSTRILLNDESGEIIQHQCELLQGDPLSPMLFILVMSMLNSYLLRQGQRDCCRLFQDMLLDRDSPCILRM
jgi:hypothetical protein